jgi:hypothetical protein
MLPHVQNGLTGMRTKTRDSLHVGGETHARSAAVRAKEKALSPVGRNAGCKTIAELPSAPLGGTGFRMSRTGPHVDERKEEPLSP